MPFSSARPRLLACMPPVEEVEEPSLSWMEEWSYAANPPGALRLFDMVGRLFLFGLFFVRSVGVIALTLS